MFEPVKVTLDDIIRGSGTLDKISGFAMKRLAKHIVCKDGTVLSVQASSAHYCNPRNNLGPYTHVEVGYPSTVPPKTWAGYADGQYPSEVYACVPVELVREFVNSHGGEKVE